MQSQKTAELLLDLRVTSIVRSSTTASIETAGVISRVSYKTHLLVLSTLTSSALQNFLEIVFLWILLTV